MDTNLKKLGKKEPQLHGRLKLEHYIDPTKSATIMQFDFGGGHSGGSNFTASGTKSGNGTLTYPID